MTGQRKERPILFNAEMVNAILSGHKAQTRRLVKSDCMEISENDDGALWPWSEDCEHAEDYWHPCPLGVVGDQLWVRENFRMARSLDLYSPNEVAGLALDAGYKLPWAPIQLEADGVRTGRWAGFNTPPVVAIPGKLRPSLHMPRWASRINLLITGVRVEQLNDISEQDAKAEGAQQYDINRFTTDEINLLDSPLNNLETPYTNGFALLWESCYGSGSWAANPFVWVIDFEKIN